MIMNQPMLLTMFLVASAIVIPYSLQVEEEIYGIVQSRPAQGDVGDWIIGGRTFTATARTEIDLDAGPLTSGTCASVELRGKVVTEIESESPLKCRAAPAGG